MSTEQQDTTYLTPDQWSEIIGAVRAEHGAGFQVSMGEMETILREGLKLLATHYEQEGREKLKAIVFGDEIKRGVLYRQQGEDGRWSSWQVAELGIPSLLAKGQDRADYEVEQVLSVDSLAAALSEKETDPEFKEPDEDLYRETDQPGGTDGD